MYGSATEDAALRIPMQGATDGASFLASIYGYKWLPSGIDSFNVHSLTPTAGTVYGTRILVPGGETILKLAYHMQAAGVGNTAAQNLVAIYDANGNKLYTSPDQSAGGFAATTLTALDLSAAPVIVPAGTNYVDVAFLFNTGTSVAVPWLTALTASSPAASQTRAWTGRTGATTMAATTGALAAINNLIFAALG